MNGVAWINLGVGAGGAVIGGACAVVAVFVQNHLNRNGQEENEKKLIGGYLRALHDELETLWNRYYETAGQGLEALPDGQPFLFMYPVNQDYFTVYTMNSLLLSRAT